jgi:hypothetical protein
MLKDVEKAHACTVYLQMSSDGPYAGNGWLHYGLSTHWPNIEHSTLAGAAYALLVKLDWDLGSEQFVKDDRPA